VIYHSIGIDKSHMIQITNSAKTQLVKYANDNKVPAIRFLVTPSGCTGYQYLLEPVETIDASLTSVDLGEGVKLQVSSPDAFLIAGTTIDYVKVGFNSKFIYNNPNILSFCGCGESFRA
jgi:iron-sulfur cluster assembly accessory protein